MQLVIRSKPHFKLRLLYFHHQFNLLTIIITTNKKIMEKKDAVFENTASILGPV